MKPDVCSAEGCEMEVSYGDLVLCSGHYRRYERARNRFIVAKNREPGDKAKATILAGVRESGPLRARRRHEDAACSVDGCDEQSKAHELCNMHYMRAVRAGDVVPVTRG